MQQGLGAFWGATFGPPKPKPFQCPTCLKNLAHEKALRAHVKEVHEKKVELSDSNGVTAAELRLLREAVGNRILLAQVRGSLFCLFVHTSSLSSLQMPRRAHPPDVDGGEVVELNEEDEEFGNDFQPRDSPIGLSSSIIRTVDVRPKKKTKGAAKRQVFTLFQKMKAIRAFEASCTICQDFGDDSQWEARYCLG